MPNHSVLTVHDEGTYISVEFISTGEYYHNNYHIIRQARSQPRFSRFPEILFSRPY